MSRRPSSAGKPRWSWSDAPALIGPVLALGVVVAFFVVPLSYEAVDLTRHPLHRDDAGYRHALVVPGPDRDLLAIVSEDWIYTFDVRSGEEVARGRTPCPGTDASPSWFVPDGALIWGRCGTRSGLLVDLRTAQIVLDTDALGERHPELALGVRVTDSHVSHDVDAPARGLPVTLHDGRSAWILADGELAFEPPETPPWRPGYFCWPEHWCSLVRQECLGFQPSEDGHGMRLAVHRRHGQSQGAPAPVEGWPTGLLKPGLVGDPTSRCAFEHEQTYLIVHDSAAFDPKETMLSLVERGGVRRWTLPIVTFGAEEPFGPRVAQRLGAEVLVLNTNRRSRSWLGIAVLDLATGEVRAAHRLVGQER